MQVKIKQISGLQDIINTPVSMGVEYTQIINISIPSTGDDFQTAISMDYTPFADSFIQVQVNGLTVEGSYTDKLGGFYFSNDSGITVKSIAGLESGDFLYWNGLIKGYQLEVGDIVTISYEKEYLSYGTSGISGNGSGIDGYNGTSGVDGTSGTAGTSGIDGINGSVGTSGLNGSNGTSGIDGINGTSGLTGSSGTSGLTGSSGTSGLKGPAGETLSVSGVVENYNTLISVYGSIIGEFQPVLLTTVILKNTSELYIYDNVSGSADLNGWVNMGEIQGPQGISGSAGTSGLTGTNGISGTSGLTGSSGTSGSAGTSGLNGTSGVSPVGSVITSGSTYQATSSISVTSATPVDILSFTIPIAGTFEITYFLRAQGVAGFAGEFALYNNSNVVLTNSEILATYGAQAGTGTGKYIVTTTESTTYKLKAYASSGSFSSFNDFNGRTGVVWNSLSGQGVSGSSGTSGSTGSSGTSGINGRRNITHVGVSAASCIIFIADNKIFGAKGNDGSTPAYQQALYPGANGNTGLQCGVNQMYEIPVLGESGTLVKADFYGFSAYALYDNGNLYTWGYNGYGNLGNGGTTAVDYPTRVQTGVIDVYTHTSNMTSDPEYNRLLIKKSDGKIYGTGYNGYYQFGLGNTTNRTSFIELPWAGTNPLSVWNIGTYSGMIIVQKSDGTIVMSGMNEYGRLGIGNYTTPTTATSAASSAWLNNDTTYRIKWVYGGERFYNGNWNSSNGISMLLDNGTQTRIVGAGVNGWGIIGDNTTTQRNVPTVPTGNWTSVKQMVGKGAIVSSIWALKNDGTLWNWGRNAESQLGRGNNDFTSLPAQVMTGVAKLWEGSQSLLYYSYYQASPIIEKIDGTYWTCGYNDYFGLGTGQATGYYNTFQQMRFPNDFSMKYFGQTVYNNNSAINYAVSTTNDIYCWGYNGGYHIDPNDASSIAVPIRFSPNALVR